MKSIFTFILFLFISVGHAQISLCSWNLENFGKSKSPDAIEFIANTLKDFDVAAIQEVVAGNGGPQAVAKLADALNRAGTKWEYCVSDPTSGTKYSTERYAFLWKSAKIKPVGKATLEVKYAKEIDREPFVCTFESDGKQFTVISFHAIPKGKQPESEIKYLKLLPDEYLGKNLIFAGDFNCPQSHGVFEPLRKLNFRPAFTKQKTSLKKACRNNDCLASEYDNIWFNTSKILKIKVNAIYFYTAFKTLKLAKEISDHIPVQMEFSLK
ncbi:endonuclease/exonuclease/phosphatase family protein [Flavobacterium sp. 3HN19-14]|uniref:endonuclease/exonuclease/phosphatase family protein n=1 Tax=Flavobacterium sp. 3HN19-14 TaxID=3448133 RepID=UPI003EE1CE4F